MPGFLQVEPAEQSAFELHLTHCPEEQTNWHCSEIIGEVSIVQKLLGVPGEWQIDDWKNLTTLFSEQKLFVRKPVKPQSELEKHSMVSKSMSWQTPEMQVSESSEHC